MNQPSLTPQGVYDHLPTETQIQTNLIKKIETHFIKKNYKRVKTPFIEYYDTLAIGMGSSLEKKAIKFFDTSGKTVVLRPDHTTPIARLVATKLKAPTTVYYIDPVFRKQKDQSSCEILQAGVEHIGSNNPSDIADLIQLASTILNDLGHTHHIFNIGHTSFSKNLTKTEKNALLNGDYITYGKLPERTSIPPEHACDNIKNLYQALKKKEKVINHITFNTGLIKNLNYYTGVIIECYSKGYRKKIGSGGQYDTLLKKFGHDAPAFGFAFNLTTLQGHTQP